MKKYLPLIALGIAWHIVLFAALWEVGQLRNQVAELESREPCIIYTVDNAGAQMVGKLPTRRLSTGSIQSQLGLMASS